MKTHVAHMTSREAGWDLPLSEGGDAGARAAKLPRTAHPEGQLGLGVDRVLMLIFQNPSLEKEHSQVNPSMYMGFSSEYLAAENCSHLSPR